MKAKKKKVESIKPEDLGLDFVSYFVLYRLRISELTKQSPRLETISLSEPAKRQGGGKVSYQLESCESELMRIGRECG